MKEININEIDGLKVGNAEDREGVTGCTVLLFDRMSPAGVDVRGGGPASRETPLLAPVASAEGINAVLLSGGSAYSLDAAGGVMKYLEEKGQGFQTGVRLVPLVCQSALFDLVIGAKTAHPDASLAFKACENAEEGIYQDGNYGAGMGCTVGKFRGPEFAMKSGVGSYAIELGDLKIGAVVGLNALGDIFDTDGNQIAGILNEDKKTLGSTVDLFTNTIDVNKDLFAGNTTIGAVITNGKFNKTEMNKIASMAQNGLARSINPVHTTADGDSVYAISTGDVVADINGVGTLAAMVMSKAIERAAKAAEGICGYKAHKDIF